MVAVIMSELNMTETKIHSIVVMEFCHSDDLSGSPMVVWCRWNMDGSIYVDWERAAFLRDERRAELVSVEARMMAGLLFAARGKFVEVSAERSLEIGRDAAITANKRRANG